MRLNKLEVLDGSELREIHEVSLRILAETGVLVSSQRALNLLEEAGAQVDLQKKLAKIPKRLVEDSLDSVPKRFCVYKRNSKEIAFVLGEPEIRAIAGGDALFFIDSNIEKQRRITKSDVIQFTRIADALPNIDMVCPAGMPQDVAPKATALHGADAVFRNTAKPLYFPHEGLSVTKAALEIVRVISEETDLSTRPILICQVSPTSPLSWTQGAVDPLMEIAKSGVPCCILPQPLSGVTAPFTLAGHIVLHNAEILSGLVISQIVKKGAPIVYGQAWTTFDMRKNSVSFASPEAVLLRIAGTQLAKFYGIPSMTTGLDTDAFCIDVQNGWEKLITGFSVLSIGSNLIADFGLLGSDTVVSNEQLIIDNEILDIGLRLDKGIKVSAETMAASVIHTVGPRGNYLCEKHTLRHLRTGEHWQPSISSRSNYEAWTKKGSLRAEQRAKQKVKEILRISSPEPLDGEKQREIDLIIERFESTAK